jgi:hypothetical protein
MGWGKGLTIIHLALLIDGERKPRAPSSLQQRPKLEVDYLQIFSIFFIVRLELISIGQDD